MTATIRWSHSRGSTFFALTVLACISLVLISSNGHSSSRSPSVSPFVRRDANVTTFPTSSSTLDTTTTVSSSTSTTPPSSTQSSTSSFTSISSDTTHSITIRSSSTTSSIPSQSLSISSSSIHPSTTSVVTSTSTESSSSSLVDPTPSVTLDIFTDNILPTTSAQSSSTDRAILPTSSSVSSASSSSSSNFWSNKAAVAAVFVIVALIACGLIAILIIAFFKRRSARREQQLHDALFDHYTDPTMSRTHSNSPSINSTPMDAFSTREVGHGNSLFFQSATTQAPQLMASSTIQQNQRSPRYIPPSLSKIATGWPVAFHNRVKRESAQPSIDSFYGAQPSDYKVYPL